MALVNPVRMWRSVVVAVSAGAIIVGPTPVVLAGTTVSPASHALRAQHGDVDGDGKRDRVKVVQVGETPQLWARVSVTSSRTGRTAQLKVKPKEVIPWGMHLAYVTPMDDRRGAEIVLVGTSGANSVWYIVVTWRNGKLLLVPRPGSKPGDEWRFLWPEDTRFRGLTQSR